MLRAFIDGSHNDDIEVVAGFVATDPAWVGFDATWNAILDRYKLDHFHTTDYWARTRPYNRLTDTEHTQLREDICQALKNTSGIAFGSIVWKGVYEQWRVSRASYEHSDAHYFGLDRSLRFLIHGINTHPVDDGVEIMCDNDKEHERIASDMHKWHEARLRQVKQRIPGHPDPQRAINFSFGISRDNPGLQVADVISNSAFRWGTSEFAGAYQDPLFLVGIRERCPIGIMPFSSKEVIDIEVSHRNRPQDELD
jgi:Protein of unknown function (DUF3800)